MDLRQQAQQALQNPNVRAFLDMLSAAEGTEQHGYATAYGGGAIESLSDHPRVQHAFRETSGKRNTTTAAGRYQFLASTWDDVAGKLGLTDFGALSQDLAAVELLRRAGALEAITEGDFDTAVKRSGKTWASLPSSPYAQPKRSAEFIAKHLPPPAAAPDRVAELPAWLQDAIRASTADDTALGALPAATAAPADAAPAGMVPAGEPNAVQRLLAMMAPSPAASAQPLAVTEEPEFTPEDDQLLAQALSTDIQTQRDRALAAFTGKPYTPGGQLELPAPLEASINRYLAQL